MAKVDLRIQEYQVREGKRKFIEYSRIFGSVSMTNQGTRLIKSIVLVIAYEEYTQESILFDQVINQLFDQYQKHL